MAMQLAPLRVQLRCSRTQSLFWSGYEAQRVCIQQRGKKKIASTLKVRLLEDVPRYGRRGAIVPVTSGLMRNNWFPKRQADYMTDAQLRTLNMRDTAIERDFNFRPDRRKQVGARQEDSEAIRVIDMQSQLLPPQRATDLISTLLPPVIDFYRAPINDLTEKPNSNSFTKSGRAVNSAAADLAAASEPAFEPDVVAIYGSVSTQDIASAIKAVLALDMDGARVVVGQEEITFVQGAESEVTGETDRVKSLGEFQIAINVKGGSTITRTVKVHAQEPEH